MNLLLVVLALGAPDGMPIRDGRFVGGAVTILTLDAGQVRGLATDRNLLLSFGQREALRSATGESPRSLWIYDSRLGENDCCCGAENRGLRYGELLIEVPHRYLRGYRAPSVGDGLLLAVLALPMFARAIRLVRNSGA